MSKQANTKRLGVDIPADLKTEVAIKAHRANLTLTKIIIRFLSAWVDGKIEVPAEK